jgi:hypothetical protein
MDTILTFGFGQAGFRSGGFHGGFFRLDFNGDVVMATIFE